MSTLPGCAGQAVNAVSAYIQVIMKHASKLLKVPKSECPNIWIRLPRHKWPKSWSSMEDPVVPFERNLYGHSLAGLLCERQFEKVLLKYCWGKVCNWECLFVHREKGLFLSVYVDDIKLAGNKISIRCGKYQTKKLIWENQHLSLIMYTCTQRQCEISKDIVDNNRTMFESRISAGATKNYHARKFCVSYRGLMIWKVMQRNVSNDFVSWQTKRLNSSTKYQVHALTTITPKKKN